MKKHLLILLSLGLAVVGILSIVRHKRHGAQIPSQAAGSKAPVMAPTLRSSIEKAQSNEGLNVEQMATKERLYAGGREWKLTFAAIAISGEIKVIIAQELNSIFGHLSLTEIDKLPFPIDGQLNGRKVQLTHRVRLEGGVRKGPRELMDDPFMCLVDGKVENGLYIPISVIDAYRQAVERSQKYAPAYVALQQIVATLNDLGRRPTENVKDLILLTDENKSEADGLSQLDNVSLASAWGQYKYREPSVLQITETRGTPLEKYGLLVAQIYFGPKLNEFFPLIYRTGRWQILVGRGD